MPRPDRQWERFHGTISPVAKDYIEKQARDLQVGDSKVDPGTALDVILWRSCLRPSDEDWHPRGRLSQATLERSFGEDALDALLDPRATRLLEDKLFPPEKPLGGRQRETQALLKRWRRFRLIDPEHRVAVLQVMHALGKKPTVEVMNAVDEDWYEEDVTTRVWRERSQRSRKKHQ